MTTGFTTPRRLAVGLLAGAVWVLALLAPTPGTAARSARAEATDRPNIVLITADDMRLADLEWMPLTRDLFAEYGMSFRNGFSPHPLCCPARAQILTGQYAQNNRVLTNNGVYGGFPAFRNRGNHVGAWLEKAGYRTAFVGKYLNRYRWLRDGPQPGWTYWDPTVTGVYAFTDFTQYRNGAPEVFVDDYITDVVRDTTVDLIQEGANDDAPLFVWASYVAPHTALVLDESGTRVTRPPIPAPRHVGRYAGVTPDSWEDPGYNERDVRDKPRLLRKPRVDAAALQDLFTHRIESLAALDQAVQRTFTALENTDQLANTIVVFTSDNGFNLGEHRHVGKIVAYEQSVRVPFLVAAPTLPAGSSTGRTVALLDLAPTFLEAAGAFPGRKLDGRSFLHATPSDGARRTLLVQAGNDRARKGGRTWDYRGLRTTRYTFTRWYTGEEELYDRRHDPAQLGNRAERRRYRGVVVWARKATRRLGDCAGASCRREPPPPPRVR